ncbi:UNVERIFIED_CONTAM: hypothetical protein PYX00_010730 [Menopon gallinae]|uniref:MOSC domain-containing protein n=1 Tax=Menopon gallinae TaxID=328185 RepID=A0AAW2HGL2_9NEOP
MFSLPGNALATGRTINDQIAVVSMEFPSNFGTVGKVAAVAVVSVIFISWLQRIRGRRIPTAWTEIGEVSHLCIYPLKSGKAIRCSRLSCTDSGVALGDARDRMFLVIDANGKCQSGREYPRLTQVAAEVVAGRLKLSGPDCDSSVEVVLPSEGDPVRLRIWEAAAEGIDCGDDAAEWITRYLRARTPLRILYRSRNVSGKDLNPGMKKLLKMTKNSTVKSDAGLFSDTFSYHLVTQSSIDDLNRRLEDGKVTLFNFRPNIVVKGEAILPFEEDRWAWVKIGDVVFRFLAPCMRCSFTTIDPETAIRSADREPIATLKRYRLVRDPRIRELVYTPTMGIYLGARSEGVISVGDKVFIPETLRAFPETSGQFRSIF